MKENKNTKIHSHSIDIINYSIDSLIELINIQLNMQETDCRSIKIQTIKDLSILTDTLQSHKRDLESKISKLD